MENGVLMCVLESADGKEERRQVINPRTRERERRCSRIYMATFLQNTWALRRQKLRKANYWINRQNDFKHLRWKYAVCAASDRLQIRPKAPMRQYIVGSLFGRIVIFSKWVEVYAMPNQVNSTLTKSGSIDLVFC